MNSYSSLDIKRTSRISRHILSRTKQNGDLSDSTIENIERCGQGFILFMCKHDPTHKLKVMKKSCNWSFCPDCMKKVGRKQMFKLRQIISQFKTKRMFTLAFVNTRRFTREIVDKRLSQYSLVIRHLKKRGLIDSYVRVLEVKKNGLTYNMHIHVVYDGRYIPYKYLGQIFSKVTKGESYIVDIRAVGKLRNHTKNYVAQYLSKYLTKFPNLRPLDAYYNYYVALKNVRKFQSSLRLKIRPFKACCPICQGDVEVYFFNTQEAVSQFQDEWRDYYIKNDEI